MPTDFSQWIGDAINSHSDLIVTFLVGLIGGSLTLRAALAIFFENLLKSPEVRRFWARVVYAVMPISLREFMHSITTAEEDSTALG